MAVYVPTPEKIVAYSSFDDGDQLIYNDAVLGQWTLIVPGVDAGSPSTYVKRIGSFAGVGFGNCVVFNDGDVAYGDPPISYGSNAGNARIGVLENDQVDLADRDFVIQILADFKKPGATSTGDLSTYVDADRVPYVEQCDRDETNFSWRVALRENSHACDFYASQDGVNVELVARSFDRSQNNPGPVLYTISRLNGYVSVMTANATNNPTYYWPHNIHLGGQIRMGGSGLITEHVPNLFVDRRHAPLQVDNLLIVLDEGIDGTTGIGDIPTDSYDEPNATTLTITQQPQNTSVAAGSDAVFTCAFTSTDGPIAYQWREEGVGDMVGEDATTLTLTNVQFADSGRQFTCNATDQGSSLRTAIGGLTVLPPSPVIDTQPVDISGWYGELLTNARVFASGNNPLSYQWYWQDDDTEVVINGTSQQSSTLFFWSKTETDNGRRVYCRVTDTVTMDYLDTVPILITLAYGILGPEDVVAPLGSEVMFTVYTAPGLTTDYYEWLYADDDSEAHPNTGGGNQQITLTLDGTNDGRSIYAKWEGPDGLGAVSRDALLSSTGAPDPGDPTDVERDMLVWNFEDDNFTWGDAGVDTGTVVQGAVCMQYVFEPGWQTPWIDLIAAPAWEDDTNRWIDYFGHGNERDAYWLTRYGLYRSDQFAKTDGVKSYYLRRLNIDMDMLVDKWTTNLFKHLRQFYFHMQSDRFEIDMTPNTFEFATGWSKNLMDSPAWRTPIEVNLQGTVYDGRHKIDLRTTGRYLSMNFDFSKTEQFALTGGDMDAEESHGR